MGKAFSAHEGPEGFYIKKEFEEPLPDSVLEDIKSSIRSRIVWFYEGVLGFGIDVLKGHNHVAVYDGTVTWVNNTPFLGAGVLEMNALNSAAVVPGGIEIERKIMDLVDALT
jgi:hypothetical protein